MSIELPDPAAITSAIGNSATVVKNSVVGVSKAGTASLVKSAQAALVFSHPLGIIGAIGGALIVLGIYDVVMEYRENKLANNPPSEDSPPTEIP
jgi:hypothetical protein